MFRSRTISTDAGTDEMPKPFADNACLRGGSLDVLRAFLEEKVSADCALCEGYKVSDLVADLDAILDGMWSDGIDAMGEDA